MSRQALKNIFQLIKQAQEFVPAHLQFLSDLKATIEKQAEQTNRKPSQYYKPSAMNCVRNMYYQRTGAEVESDRMNACLVGIVESGSNRHDTLQATISRMKDFGIDCEYIDVAEYVKQRGLDYLEVISRQGHETKLLHKDLNISFLCDGIIGYKGQYYILEIKTETIYKWQTRESVATEHLAQGTTYSICFNIDKVIFLYENRDNCDKKAYLLDVTDEMKEELVLSKINECEKHLAAGTLPSIDINITKKDCQYCNYKKQCKMDLIV